LHYFLIFFSKVNYKLIVRKKTCWQNVSHHMYQLRHGSYGDFKIFKIFGILTFSPNPRGLQPDPV
jgi:hypothetical protein